MIVFLWNVMLALVWTFAIGDLTASSLAIGFVLGWFVLWLGRDVVGARDYTRRTRKIAELAGFFAWELLVANLRVAWDVVTLRHYMRPAIVAVPLDVTTDGAITLLSNLISLTPGTLIIDISPDRRILYVHSMYTDDPEVVKRQLKEGFERRVLEVMR
jgi:multicomponent Na+:H+ antiporter subunit E